MSSKRGFASSKQNVSGSQIQGQCSLKGSARYHPTVDIIAIIGCVPLLEAFHGLRWLAYQNIFLSLFGIFLNRKYFDKSRLFRPQFPPILRLASQQRAAAFVSYFFFSLFACKAFPKIGSSSYLTCVLKVCRLIFSVSFMSAASSFFLKCEGKSLYPSRIPVARVLSGWPAGIQLSDCRWLEDIHRGQFSNCYAVERQRTAWGKEHLWIACDFLQENNSIIEGKRNDRFSGTTCRFSFNFPPSIARLLCTFPSVYNQKSIRNHDFIKERKVEVLTTSKLDFKSSTKDEHRLKFFANLAFYIPDSCLDKNAYHNLTPFDLLPFTGKHFVCKRMKFKEIPIIRSNFQKEFSGEISCFLGAHNPVCMLDKNTLSVLPALDFKGFSRSPFSSSNICITKKTLGSSQDLFGMRNSRSASSLDGEQFHSFPTLLFAHRHANFKTLERPADQRKALLRALTTQVLRHGKIKTTETKAKAVRKWVDKMISLAKRGTLHTLRQALAWVYDKRLVFALFKVAPERYKLRSCGYCRVVKLPHTRKGDSARMAEIELL